MGGQSDENGVAAASRDRGDLSAAGRGRGRACLVGRAGQSAAPDAADRRAVARRLARERLRRARAQHHSHGRQHHRASDRRGRRHLAAVRSLRAGLGGRQTRPCGDAGLLLVVRRARTLRRAPGTSARGGIPARDRARGLARGGRAGARRSAARGRGAAGGIAGRAGPGRAARRSRRRRRDRLAVDRPRRTPVDDAVIERRALDDVPRACTICGRRSVARRQRS